MKRLLPLFLVLAGAFVLVGVYFFVIRKPKTGDLAEETALQEVVLADRPETSLTPSSDGHWLKLKVEKIKIAAASMDYELLYSLPDGRTQGVPGTITLKGATSIERDLLLGSESSGKFRYDEGVSEGSLSLRFRNEKGKLIAKFSTKFHLQTNEKELTSVDEKLTFSLNKLPAKTFFVTMETFGFASEPTGVVRSGPYGIFASGAGPYPGKVTMTGAKLFVYKAGAWIEVVSGESSDIGIFVATD